MGVGSSSFYLGKGESYAERAKKARELPDHILTVFFEKADFKDLLSLSSIASCPRYVFTTAEALDTLFQKIQIYPKLGKKGEILFAPLSQLAPGSIQDRQQTQELKERTTLRNQMCMDIAYYYVRIFQIYAALALTVLDADPLRRKSLKQLRPTGYGMPTKGPQAALFHGGALAQRNPIRKEILNTPFAPLADYFSQSTSDYLKLDDKTAGVGEFFIQWISPRTTRPEMSMSLPAIYRKNGVPKEVTVTMTKSSNTQIDMFIDSENIQTFFYSINKWQFKYDDPTNSTKPEGFYANIHDYFASFDFNVKRAAGPGQAAPGVAARPVAAPGAVASGIGVTSGRTSFEGFDQIKKLYEDRAAGKEFPKAYCIARAMILMMPIFDSERLDKHQKFYSQICKREFDFETIADAMPRPGRQPKANIYLKSLVSLYYDDYQFKGDQVTFTQTESGRSELRDASKKLAALYDIKTNPETFIESSTEFKAFPVCSKYQNALLEFRDDNLRRQIQNEVIRPMLDFQESHTAKVNALLKQMFEVKVDKQGRPTMKFSSTLRSGGREKVNEFGRKAHDLLLDYYLKSEAYFIKGVLLLERNPDKFIPVV
jgi:hypothetical protein